MAIYVNGMADHVNRLTVTIEADLAYLNSTVFSAWYEVTLAAHVWIQQSDSSGE